MLVRNPGTTAPLNATFIDGNGDRIDVDPLTVDILDPSNVVVVNDDDPDHISTGYYHYSYAIPNDAEEGNWKIVWTGVLDGNPVVGSEFFNVTTDIIFPSDTTKTLFRARVGERKEDPNGDGSETRFTDDEIDEIFLFVDGDIDLATLEGWIRKTAIFAELIDISESGTTRDMGQKFKNAKEMVNYWKGIAGDAAKARLDGLRGRVVGRAVNLREIPAGAENGLPMPRKTNSDVIVTFPDHEIIISPGP